MSIVIAILPLLLVLVMLMAKKKLNRHSDVSNKTKRISITPKGTKRILASYVMLLLGFMIVSLSLPRNEPEFEPVSTIKEQRFVEMYKSLSEGAQDKVPSDLLLDEWVQEVEGDTFRIVNEHSNWLPISILVERVETTEHAIQATLYDGIHVITSYEIPGVDKGFKLNWGNENVTVVAHNNSAISLSFFEEAYLFNQVKDDQWRQLKHSAWEQYPILYLRVPNHIELIAEEHGIERVGK